MKNFRLCSPIKVTSFLYDEEDMYYTDEAVEVYDDTEYYEVIKDRVERYALDENDKFVEKGLMEYFYDDEKEIYKSISEKVKSAIVGVTVLSIDGNKKLFGVCDLKLKEDLTVEEQKVFYDYLTGQYSDGFGEGFEQQDIDVNIYSDERQINVHLWTSREFYIMTEDEMDQAGYMDLHPRENAEGVKQEEHIEQDDDFAMEM